MKLPTCLFCSFLAIVQSASSLEIRSYLAQRHDRFLDFPTAPKINPDFLYAATDLTGVGWYLAPSNTTVERRRQYTLVSPKHFVGANHFRPSVNGKLQFLGRDGVVRTYDIESVQPILNANGDPSDLLLGTLETEVSATDGIDFQPFLSLPDPAYIGQELIFMGHFRSGSPTLRAGRAVFQARSEFGRGTALGGDSGIEQTETFTWTNQNSTLLNPGNPDDSFTEPGDSGSPSLVVVDGRGALVGIHTAAGSANLLLTSQNISIDTFVPFYADGLNAIMAEEGYHMTRAVPGPDKPETTLDLVPQIPEVVRAGYPVEIPLTVSNEGLAEDANNLVFSVNLPAVSDRSLVGEGWVSSVDGSGVQGRKGGLAPGQESVMTIGFTPSTPGLLSSFLVYAADEFAETSEVFEIEIIESFRSWSEGLAEAGVSGDSDRDGISNLQEYAFGGNPRVGGLFSEFDGESLLPTLEMGSGGLVFDFLRRTDAGVRGLGYFVEVSSDLSAESWEPLVVDPGQVEEVPVGDGFERVRIGVAGNGESNFYRLRLELAE